jgi:RecA/RadA recombinase
MDKNKLLKTIKKIEGGKVYQNYEFFDSGCFTLNALISGDIFGGFRTGGLTHLAAESSVGKSLLAINAGHQFLQKYEDALLYYVDTEHAITMDDLEKRGLDTDRCIISHTNEIHALKQDLIEIMDSIEEGKTSPQLCIVVDSIGAMVSKKEIDDIRNRNDKKDMTKAQETNALIRNMTYLAGEKNVCLITCGHVYENIGGMGYEKAISGGNGVKYFPNLILTMTKSKHKSGLDVIGSNIRCKTFKSRLSKENQVVVITNTYEKGLEKWSGMIEFAIEAGVAKKSGSWVQFEGHDAKAQSKAIYREPEKYFTPEILEKINYWVKQNFNYGNQNDTVYDMEEQLDQEAELTVLD